MNIDNGFEGANPAAPGEVVMTAPDAGLVRPWSEDGDGNYKFCMNVKVRNDEPAPRPLTLRIDWADAEYMDVRDYVLIGRGDDWTYVPGRNDGTVTTVHMTVPPGEWHVATHPVYDLARWDADRKRAVAAGFAERVIGRSFHGRAMTALTIGDAGKPAVFIVSRFHPYETAGSFCAAAILEQLAADAAAGGALTKRFRFVLVPMTNPDGVALGCPKRCRQGGADICHEAADGSDPAGAAIAALLDETKPVGYLDFHGWMHRDGDGLSYSQEALCQTWRGLLAGEPALDKRWKPSFSEKPLNPADFRSRAWRMHNAFALILSITWFDRTVPQMRTIGQRCLAAMCRTLEAT